MAPKRDFTNHTVEDLVNELVMIGREWMGLYHSEIEEKRKEINEIKKEIEKRIITGNDEEEKG